MKTNKTQCPNEGFESTWVHKWKLHHVDRESHLRPHRGVAIESFTSKDKKI